MATIKLNPQWSRSREATAFLDALQEVPANAVTACRGWTVHDIVAHLTAGAVALADQAEAYLAGDPVPPFGSWDERDARFRAFEPSALRRQLEASEARMTRAFDTISASDPLTVIPGGGWSFSITHLAIHMRQEFALHRWDFVGDDSLSDEFLAQPELLAHSVSLMDQWLLARGLENDEPSYIPFRAWVRCAGQPDLLIEASGGRGRLRFEPFPGNAQQEGFVEADAAARLLLTWGRHPSAARRIRSSLPPEALMRLVGLLAGF